MATNLKLQDTMNWASSFLKGQPQTINGMEPALTTGNVVLQTIYGAPFKWRHNRGTFSFQTVIGQNDYPVQINDFGFLEDQVVIAGTAPKQTIHQLGGKFSLARPTGSPSRPIDIAPQFDDGAGNITFRTSTSPDQVYTIQGDYQCKSPLLRSPASLIGNVPDEFAFVFNWGYLTIISMIVDDPRFPIWEKYFIGRLLGLQDGLDEIDVNIFLGLWQTNTKTALRTQGQAQQGQNGRAV